MSVSRFAAMQREEDAKRQQSPSVSDSGMDPKVTVRIARYVAENLVAVLRAIEAKGGDDGAAANAVRILTDAIDLQTSDVLVIERERSSWKKLSILLDRHAGEVRARLNGELPALRRALSEAGLFTLVGDPDDGNCDYGPSPWEPPIPLSVGDPPEFPLDSLPAVLRNWVSAEAEATQTPAGLSAMMALGVIAMTIARRFIVSVWPGWIEPTNVFCLAVMPSASRKSAVFRDAMTPIVSYERNEAERLRPMIAEWDAAQKILEKRLAHVLDRAAKAGGDEAAELEREAACLSKELAERKPIVAPRLAGDDCSPERLASLMALHGGRFAVAAPEGDLFDILGGRYSSGVNLGAILRAHAGDTLIVDRVSRASECIHNPALTVLLAVQPDVINGLAQHREFRGRGLMARFLYCVPPSTVGRRRIKPQPMPDRVAAAYSDLVADLLGISPTVDENGEAEPYTLRFADDALDEVTNFAASIEPRLGDLGDLGAIGDWASKLVGAVVRLCGILHIAEHADAATWNAPISAATAQSAIRIGHYLIGHARAAFGLMGADPAVEDARRVLTWIDSAQARTFTKRDVHQAFRGRFKLVTDIEPCLLLLGRHNFVREVTINRVGPGRKPSPSYEVNPAIASHITHNTQNSIREGNSEYCEHSEKGWEII